MALNRIRLYILSILIITSVSIIIFENKYLIINSYLISKFYQKHTQVSEKSEVNKIILNSHRNKFETYRPIQENITTENANTWIMNNRVAQYSSRIVLKDNNWNLFEALIFYYHENQTSETIQRNLKFLIKSGDEYLFLDVTLSQSVVTLLNTRLWKLSVDFEFDKKVYLENIVFLVTDINEYQKMIMTNPEELRRLLIYHKPVIYDSRKVKKAAIAHCVHMVRGLKDKKLNQMKTWLVMQKIMGIDRIKLYFSEEDKIAQDEIRKLGSSNTPIIEIVDFRFAKF